MDNFDLKKYLAEGRLYENNDSVGMINYLKSLPDQYDMSDSQYDLWEDTMESIEGFTSQEIKNYIKDLPNLWDMSGSQYDLWEDIMDNFDLKKDLAEGKLFKEDYKSLSLTPQQEQEFMERIQYLANMEGKDIAMNAAGDILARELSNDEIEWLEDIEEMGYDADEVETTAINLASRALKFKNKTKWTISI
jgi:hypothetical protein